MHLDLKRNEKEEWKPDYHLGYMNFIEPIIERFEVSFHIIILKIQIILLLSSARDLL